MFARAGLHETPVGTILMAALRALESITLDRDAAHEEGAAGPELLDCPIDKVFLASTGVIGTPIPDARLRAPHDYITLNADYRS